MNRSLHSVDPEELMAYLDGELPAERARVCATHLEQCRECQALTADFRSLYQQMNSWQVGPAPESLDRAVRSSLEAEGHLSEHKQGGALDRAKTSRVRPWAWALAGAAGALVLIGLGMPNLLRYRGSYPATSREPAPSASQPHIDTYAELSAPPPSRGYGSGGIGKAQAGDTARERQKAQSQQTDEALVGTMPSGPMIARRASLTLVTKDFDFSRGQLDGIQHRRGGYAADLQVEVPAGEGRTLTASLRVPADQLDATLAEVKKLGRVEHESQSGEEVTAQYVDLNARLSNARNTEQRLVEVLNQRTGKMADVLAVENEIARVRGEIEQMEAERKGLERRVAYAELRIELKEEYKAALEVAPPSGATQLRNSLVEGLGTAADSLLGFVQLLLSCGPTLLLWALILFWPARILWRRWQAGKH